MEAKRLAAEKAVEEIKDGMIIGLGTGSTVYFAIKKIGEKVKQGLQIKAIATSLRSEALAKELNIPIISAADIDVIDIDIDGADEIDRSGNLIKGGGGALLREKIIASSSKKFIVIADETKLKDILGHFPLPVEIVPFAFELTFKKLQALGCNAMIRKSGEQNFITDNGNLIADCKFDEIDNPAMLNKEIHLIAGVVETGLFLHTMVHSVIIGHPDGSVSVMNL
jgi:ribose 5-phosphate isomerase A